MNIIKRLILRIWRLLRISFFLIPSLILYFVGVHYFSSELTGQIFSANKYTFIVSSIGLAAAFSAICFQAATSVKVKQKKDVFARAGGRFVHASLLFAYGGILKFFSDNLGDYRISPIFLSNLLKVFVSSFGSIFFLYGIIYVSIALGILNKLLFSEKDALLD
ncbi:MAG: hypothetical protein A3B47_03415 [Candidatus Levybacteria bacterium RIFCSPLOWO2_01_FULL_39_24]|nr:MAG: hypothetical protein A2800_02705 [Candidatus Levybacteria bacterium RIFCSPHIGHO2_01_FULL_40_16]OGH28233.1 MAG: hypothetical protein A3E12_00675 [Candidatus Levybacteria bacterium RIFCSPHIGHO2_12_FULL_39_9]OGH46668.1 MAG: hypothetical protein A3B47_03415 [Candidatus Levybacteria bacterium RIFCSPLOWO2_01_FULL_39_24]